MMTFLTFGLTLRGCVRLCSIIGIFASSFYVTAGVTLIMRAVQEEATGELSKPLYLYLTPQERTQAKYERMKFAVLCSLGSLLIAVNIMQIISDTLLFQLSLKSCHGRSLWIIFVADILFWVITLICFVNIFTANGILLLTVVLVGTSIRCYILYIVHSYFTQLRKSSDSNADLRKSISQAATNNNSISTISHNERKSQMLGDPFVVSDTKGHETSSASQYKEQQNKL